MEYLFKRFFRRDENSCIGDIIIHAGPFLRMYALYIDNYNNAIETIKTWKERSQEFATVVKAIESLPDCENLPLEVNKSAKNFESSFHMHSCLLCPQEKYFNGNFFFI